jgi:hypothetical protein
MGLYRGYLRLSGRRFRESGQPINNFMLLPRTRAWVSSAGFKVKTVDATGQYLPFPRREPIELHFLNRPRNLVRWFALHSFVMAEK